ncbi:hypothetical protein KI387_013439, partial [Taxus chinensis]
WDIRAVRTRRTRKGEAAANRNKEAHFRRFGRICPRQSGTVGAKARVGCGRPKEPRSNQILPRVFSVKRDREARIGRIRGICPR